MMKFDHVAQVFSTIETISSRNEITEHLAGLFKQATPKESAQIAYFSLGMLHATYEGTQFGMAEKQVAKAIAHACGIESQDVEKKAKKTGDLGDAFIELTHGKRPPEILTVNQVYESLATLEAAGGVGSQEEKIYLLSRLLNACSPEAGRYIIRIVLDTLRLGFSDMTILDALSWMVAGDKSLRPVLEHAYNVSADIGLIAALLKQEGIESLKKISCEVGIPVRPAAAERAPTAKAIIDKIGPCIAEPKLDGLRLQIHLDKSDSKKPKINFFSRNLLDMSEMFPDLAADIMELPVKNIIMEGEAIAYDQLTDSFMPFQETIKRRRKHDIDQAQFDIPMRLYLFDLLYLDGESYLDKPFVDRRKKLNHILLQQKKESSLYITPEKVVADAQELETYFIENVAAGLEGILAKRPYAQYQPGKRNFNWIKLKRIESGQLEDTIDAVLLGYNAGSGKRTHFGIGALLVGVYNEKKDTFETIAKIGTGLSDDGWKEIKKECEKFLVDTKPENVTCSKQLYPDNWVKPQLVCVVRADEITISPLHTAGKTETGMGFALRFPRFMALREDKSAFDATTVQEVKRLYADQVVLSKAAKKENKE